MKKPFGHLLKALGFLLLLMVSVLPSIGFAGDLGKTLVVSDSHGVGAFGDELANQLEQAGTKVSFYAFGGTKPVDWILGNNLTWGYWEHHTGAKDIRGDHRNTPRFAELVLTEAPNTLVIVQGTNMVWHEQNDSDREQVKAMIDLAKGVGARCIWVGPPNLRVSDPIVISQIEANHQLLESVSLANGCEFIPSWNFTQYPENGGDGIHYDQVILTGPKLAREWAQEVFKRIRSTL